MSATSPKDNFRSGKRLLFNSPASKQKSAKRTSRFSLRKSPPPKTMNPADMFRVSSPSPVAADSLLADLYSSPPKQNQLTLCDWTPNVALFGKGASGTVYKTSVCKECQFMPKNGTDIIFKIETSKDCDIGLAKVVAVNNVAASRGLSPMIYEYSACAPRNCRLYMDYVPGQTLTKIFQSGDDFLIVHVTERLFLGVLALHQILPHGHGDLNFQNVLYVPGGGKNGTYNDIVFIDFTVNYVDYDSRHYVLDYLQMLYYITMMRLEAGLHIMLFDKVLEQIFSIAEQNKSNNNQLFSDIRTEILPVYAQEYHALHAADNNLSETEIIKLEDYIYLKWKNLKGYAERVLLKIAFGIY